jgi:hypothetical protein
MTNNAADKNRQTYIVLTKNKNNTSEVQNMEQTKHNQNK